MKSNVLSPQNNQPIITKRYNEEFINRAKCPVISSKICYKAQIDDWKLQPFSIRLPYLRTVSYQQRVDSIYQLNHAMTFSLSLCDHGLLEAKS